MAKLANALHNTVYPFAVGAAGLAVGGLAGAYTGITTEDADMRTRGMLGAGTAAAMGTGATGGALIGAGIGLAKYGGRGIKAGSIAGGLIGAALSHGITKSATQYHRPPKRPIPSDNMTGRINGLNR